MADHRLEIVLSAKDASQRAFKTVTGRLRGLTKSVFDLRNAAAGLAGAAGLGYVVQRTLEATEAIGSNADMAGVGVKAWQELAYAGNQYQITAEAMADGMKELSLRADEFVQTGAGPAAEAFSRLGYQQDEVNRKLADTPGFLTEIVSRMEGLDRAAQIRIADELFGGQGGEQFVRMIRGGADALDDFRRRANEMGIVLDQDLIRKSAEARREIDTMTRILGTQFQAVLAEMAPDIASMAVDMSDWVTENKELFRQDLPEHFANIATGLGSVAKSMGWVAEKAEVFYGPATVEGRTKEQIKELEAQLGHYEELYKSAREVRDSREGSWFHEALGGVEMAQDDMDRANKNIKSIENRIAYLRKSLAGYNQEAKDSGGASEKAADGIKVLKAAAEKPGGINALAPDRAVKSARSKKPADVMGISPNEIKNAYSKMYADMGKSAAGYYEFQERKLMAQRDRFAEATGNQIMAQQWFEEQMIESYGRVEEESKKSTDAMFGHFDGFLDFAENNFESWGKSFSSTLNDMVWGADKSFKDVATSFGKMVTGMIIQWETMQAVKGVTSWIGDWWAGAEGGVLSGGSVDKRYARGGIVNKPTIFPMARGMGLMGEAGAEAIMPLTRIGGDLGVKAQSAVPNVEVNVIDNTSTEKEVSQEKPKWQGDRWVLNVVLDAANRNKGGFAKGMKAAIGKA